MTLKSRKLTIFSVLTVFIVTASELEAIQNDSISTNCSISKANCTGVRRTGQVNQIHYYLTPRPFNISLAPTPKPQEKGDNGSSWSSRLSRKLDINPFPVFSFLKSFINKPGVQYLPYKLKVKIPTVPAKPILVLTDQGSVTETPGSHTIDVTLEPLSASIGNTDTSALFPMFNEEKYHDNKYAAYAKYYGLNHDKYGWGWKSSGKKGHGKKYYDRHKGYSNDKKEKNGHGWGHKKKGHGDKHKGKGKYKVKGKGKYKVKGKGHHKGSTNYGWYGGNAEKYHSSEKSKYHSSEKGKGHKSKGHHKGKGKGHHKGNVDYGWNYEGTTTHYGGHHKGKGHKVKGPTKGKGKKHHKGKGKGKASYPKFYDSLGNPYTYTGYGKTKSAGSHHKSAYQKNHHHGPIIPVPYYRKGTQPTN